MELSAKEFEIMKKRNMKAANIVYMKCLVSLLNKASYEYYNTGTPTMTDAEFDESFSKLQELEEKTGVILCNSPTQNVGAKILPELHEVKHNHKMLSLDKCHSVEEVEKFSKNRQLVAMWKLDGMSVSIRYENGDLVSAETRGNGEIGVDITEHIKQFQNVPLHINHDCVYIIDGEAIITNSDFEEVNVDGEFANSRNLVSGTLNSLDTSVVKDRKIIFVAWDVIEGDDSNSLFKRIENAYDLGFTCVAHQFVMGDIDNIKGSIGYIKRTANKYGVPIDGVVFKFDDIAYGKSLGATAHHFRNGIAYKFLDEGAITTITDIEWSLGKTGQITPVAIFKPVEIEGSVVNRASVHNLSILSDLDLMVGDTVEVIKANMIIPQIRKNLSAEGREPQYIPYPARCPKCESPTEVEVNGKTKVVVCKNPNCEGKLLGKLKHFVSKDAMNIDGLSEKKLEMLINHNLVSNYIDLYELYDNFGMSGEVERLEGFGNKSARKLFQAIENSKTTTLDRFIYALSIPMIGKSASKTISKYFSGDFKKFYKVICEEDNFKWTRLEDFGDAMADSILNFSTSENIDMMYLLSEYMTFEADNQEQNDLLDGLTFVITGKVTHFKNRNELKNEIERRGGKVTGSISKSTDYLINNDIESTSSKNKKAKSLGVPIITEEELLVEMFVGE